jgi:hypothetical protein
MANTIKLKRSAVPGKVPTTGDLALGELGLNTFDGKLYTKKDNGSPSIVEIGGGGAGVSDGDKGDITVSSGGSTWTVDNGAITFSKIQNVSATDKLLGRSTLGAGVIEEIACTAAGRALLDDANATAQRTTLGLGTLATQNGTFSGTSSGTNTGDQTIALTGDVTGSGTGTFAATLANGSVTNAKVASNAAIDGSKISPSFGSQNVSTTGTSTAASFIPSSSTAPANGLYLPAANTVAISTASTQRATVDSSGRLLVGLTSSIGTTAFSRLELVNTSSLTEMTLARGDGSAASGDGVGQIQFMSNAGSTYQSHASITCFMDAASGVNDKPGRIVISTTPDGSSTPSERFRIAANGAWGLAGANYGTSGQVLTSNGSGSAPTWQTVSGGGGVSDGDKGDITVSSSGTVWTIDSSAITDAKVSASAAIAGTKISPSFGSQNISTSGSCSAANFSVTSSSVPSNGFYLSTTNTLAWSTASTFRALINSGGDFLVNRTSNQFLGGQVRFGVDDTSSARWAMGVRANGNAVVFNHTSNGSSAVGSISITTSSTSFNTSSDYRLKENIVPLTGAIARVNELRVRRFNFITNPDITVDGFIAHEAQAVVPECVTGTKDEVDEDGNPVYQGIDQSKLVPLLTAALQEAIGRIETLEAELTALKAS